MVMGHGRRLTAAGVFLGAAGAFTLTRFLKRLLFGVTTKAPATFIGFVLVLTLMALAACYVPARRAMRVEPMAALRDE
jgi:ABC-type lipoprotein release transport system permease subunit